MPDGIAEGEIVAARLARVVTDLSNDDEDYGLTGTL